jgi:hypothetical protein
MNRKEQLSGQETGELQRKLSAWMAEGYRVERLKEALSLGAAAARPAFETADNGIQKLKAVAAELESLHTVASTEQVAAVRALLADPWAVADAENALVELQIQTEKKRKGTLRRQQEEKHRRSSLMERTADWNARGYDVTGIEKALAGSLEDGEQSARAFEEAVAQMRMTEEELRGLDTRGFEKERAHIEDLLKRPDNMHEVEEAMLHLRVRIEKGKRETELRAAKEKDERARLGEDVRAWKEAGFIIGIGPAELERGELLALRTIIHQTGEAVMRLRELQNELENIQDPEHFPEREALRQLLHDPSNLQAAEERILRLQVREERLRKDKERRVEEHQKKRKDNEARIKDWKEAGYDTSRLEAAMAQDDETLKKEMVMFRIQLRRMKELRAELLAIPPEGVEQEVVRLMEKTRTVSLHAIAELESAVAALKSGQEARREQVLKEKEREKNEKQELVAKLMGWVEKGYRDGHDVRLEGTISKDLPAIREDIVRIEAKVRRMEVLRAELDALDTGGLEAEKAALLEILPDLSRTDEAWTHMLELKQKVDAGRALELKRAEEERSKREESRSRISEWKRLGYDVSNLEKMLQGDLETVRKELALAQMKVRRAEEMRDELAHLKADDFEKETAEILSDLPDLERIGLNEKRIEALRALVSERMAETRKRGDMQKRMEEWRIQGYDTHRLGAALKQDIETATKEFLMFRIRVQKLGELSEELRSLDITGFEEEASAIRASLMNVDGVREMRTRLSELEIKIGKRISETVRSNEERKRLKEESMTKMSSWLAEGFYIDGLEDALSQDPAEMAARFGRFEQGVIRSRKMREELDELSAPGFEEIAAGIREGLRDVSRLDETLAEMRALWERIDRRAREAEERKKEEGAQRRGLVRQIEAWREQGHIVEHLEAIAGGKVEHLRRAVLDFRIQLERRKDLAGILSALDVRGFEQDATQIRDMMKDVGGMDEASASLDRLKDRIRQKREADARERGELQRTRDECTDRFMELLAEGYNVEGLESALELPIPELARECERVDAIVMRLKEIESEVKRTGLAEGDDAVASQFRDINALPHLREWLAQKTKRRAQATGASVSPKAPEAQKTEEQGRRRELALDPEKLSALRKKLEELKVAGHDVSELEQYLDSGTITAEGMKTRLNALNRRIKGEPDSSSEDTQPLPEKGPPRDAPAEPEKRPQQDAPAEPEKPVQQDAPAEPEKPLQQEVMAAPGLQPEDELWKGNDENGNGESGESSTGGVNGRSEEGADQSGEDNGNRPAGGKAGAEPVRKFRKVKKVAK